MQERGGTSIHKILRYIGANYKVGKGFEVHARLARKKLLQAGSLVCTKDRGPLAPTSWPPRNLQGGGQLLRGPRELGLLKKLEGENPAKEKQPLKKEGISQKEKFGG